MESCIRYSQLYRITSTKCHINTVVSADDGPGEVQNVEVINKTDEIH